MGLAKLPRMLIQATAQRVKSITRLDRKQGGARPARPQLCAAGDSAAR